MAEDSAGTLERQACVQAKHLSSTIPNHVLDAIVANRLLAPLLSKTISHSPTDKIENHKKLVTQTPNSRNGVVLRSGEGVTAYAIAVEIGAWSISDNCTDACASPCGRVALPLQRESVEAVEYFDVSQCVV
eukprot:CAMPEP_0119379178 /NCGR_PEP_ID=MMETSP1334-20130426/51583_1 /TAXON_ID=127549 /ORGANISM="Calcidiscus leptoporus, Strain RCC1130" /LENGTH=130 /DNA_ID=CAMNT_0007398607 /DNA_START=215 /DNA_END=604 /DNA_ORIENTATION=+